MICNVRARVLVVDDSLAAAKRLQVNLEQAGFLVEVARNGHEGLTKALRKQFDVVLTDEQMPIKSGREMCRQLRRDIRYKHTPIVFLTARQSDLDSDELSKELGTSAVLGKPFTPAAVVHLIEKLLQPHATANSPS